jgi:hypothetical protein
MVKKYYETYNKDIPYRGVGIGLANNNVLMPYLNNENLYKIFPRSNRKYIEPNNECKELVVYGTNLSSSLSSKQYTDIVRYMVNIPNHILYMLVGVLLSDGTIAYSSKKNLENSIFNKPDNIKIEYDKGLLTRHNCRFRFKQSIAHSEYVWYLYFKLSHYCLSPPFLKIDRVKGKEFLAIEFVTMSLPCFSILKRMFYTGRVKTLPHNIYDLINYETLAHIIMGDGSYNNKGLCLNLQCYSVKELVTLINIFYIKFGLDCTLHKSRNQYVIYIKVKSVIKLYPQIAPYLIPSMRYKFNYVLTNYYTSSGNINNE